MACRFSTRQKLTLPDEPNSQTTVFRMKWQPRSVSWLEVQVPVHPKVLLSRAAFPPKSPVRGTLAVKKSPAHAGRRARNLFLSEITTGRPIQGNSPTMNTYEKMGVGYPPRFSGWVDSAP